MWQLKSFKIYKLFVLYVMLEIVHLKVGVRVFLPILFQDIEFIWDCIKELKKCF